MFLQDWQYQTQQQELDYDACSALEQPESGQFLPGNLEQHREPESIQQQADGRLD